MWQATQVSKLRSAMLALLLLTGCSGGDQPGKDGPALSPAEGGAGGAGAEVSCVQDARVDAFENGLTKTGPAGFTVSLDSSDPAEPAHGDNSWSVTVLNAAGEPLEGAQLAVSAKMPDHGHMSPTTPEATVTDADGHAQVSGLNLFMAGVWQIDLKISEDSAKQPADSVSFVFCIEG